MESNAGPSSVRRLGGLVLVVVAVLTGCHRQDEATRAVGGAPEVAVVLVAPGGALPAAACDWDGDGVDTHATVTSGRWMVREADGTSSYVESVLFGQSPGDVPVCGDWDGDGDDEPGAFRSGTFHLRSDLGPSATTREVTVGPGTPVAGDWDGDGTDTVGIVTGGRWTLTDAPGGSDPAESVTFGARPDDRPVVGDWDGDGIDTVGVVRGSDWHTSDRPRSARGGIVRGDGMREGVALAVASADGAADAPTVVRHGAGTPDPVDVHVFGDSLAVESHAAFLAAMTTGRNRPVRVTYSAFGGTAICDDHEEIARAASLGADVVVLSFSGNNITGCTLLDAGEGTCPADAPLDRRGHDPACRRFGADLHRQYLDDARWAVARVAPIPVLLVAPPTMADPVEGANPRPGTGRQGVVWRAYRQVAAEDPNVTLVDGGRLLTPDDRWVDEAPCLAGEECSTRLPTAPGRPPSTAVVRSPDGIHLCDPRAADRRSDALGCAPLLPGPYRFAGVTADAVADRLGL
jgi:hypothetical protein